MEQALYNTYIDILKTQLVPAMGCTEHIAVAYAAALAARALRKADGGREFIRNVHICVSSNIIKNVKSVIVFGRVEILDDAETVADIATKLSYKFTSDDEYIKNEIRAHGKRTLILKLTPEHMTGKLVNES